MALVSTRVFCAAIAVGLAATAIAYEIPRKADASERAYYAGRDGRNGDAVLIYSEEIQRSPADFANYLRRAMSFVKLKEYDKALADLDQAIRLSPNTMTAESLGDRIWNSTLPETHTWRLDVQAHVARAEVLEALGRHSEALVDLDYAVAVDSTGLPVRHHRGVVRTLTGHFDDALEDFDYVLSHQFNLDTLFARGLAKYLKKDWDGAVTDFASAKMRAPNNSKYAEWLAKAQFRQDAAANGTFPMPHSEPPANDGGVKVPLAGAVKASAR